MVLLQEDGGLDILRWFPCIVAFGVSKPFYEILQLSFSPLTLVALNGLNLVLFIIVNKVRW